ncbi:MAG: hypothetical protein ABR927_17320 [Bacteroidales bacterium]|jgi:hypothetical protein
MTIDDDDIVEDTDDELNLEDEDEDDAEDELNLDDEDEDDEEDTDKLIQEMLQQDIDERDKYRSKSAELQKKIDDLKRQQGMD